jgi:hypothetical protein
MKQLFFVRAFMDTVFRSVFSFHPVVPRKVETTENIKFVRDWLPMGVKSIAGGRPFLISVLKRSHGLPATLTRVKKRLS